LVNKGKLVIYQEGYFSVLVRIVIFTKLEVTGGDYCSVVNNRCFNVLSV